MSQTRVLRHDTGARIVMKSDVPAMVTRIGNAVFISVGVSPIAATPVKDAAIIKAA